MAQQLEIVNISIINEAKNLMGDRFPIMIKYFLEDVQMYMEEIEKGLKAKNAQIALTPAHTIKSSAKQLGADRLSDVAKQAEALCREMIDHGNQDYIKLAGLYSQLKDEVSSVAPELNKFC